MALILLDGGGCGQKETGGPFWGPPAFVREERPIW
jgi:hypothetical protein